MLRLSRYLKPYLALAAAAVVLLLGQAVLDLNLPDMMSDIVNVGIQRGGIEETAPRAMPGDLYALSLRFMSAEDAAAANAAYTPYARLGAEQRERTDGEFPAAEGQNAYVFTAGGEAGAAAHAAFGRANAAMTAFMQEAARQQGGGGEAAEGGARDAADGGEELLRAVRAAIPLLQAVPSAAIAPHIEAARDTPELTASGVAAVLNRAVYRELGADTDAMQTGYLLRVGAGMLAVSVLIVLCAVGAGYCFSRMGAGVARDLRRDVFAKVCGFSNAEMDRFSTASLITRTTNDVVQVQMMYVMGMRMMVFAPIMGIGGVVMALRKSAGMSWIIAAAVFIIIGIIAVLYVFVMPRFKRMQELVDRLNLVSRENLSGQMVVRAFSNQAFQQKRFDAANRELTDNSLFVGRAMTLLFPVMMLVMNGVSLFIIWLGARQIAASSLQVGDMMAFMQYSMQVIMSFLFIAMIFVMVPRAAVSAERIDEVLKSEAAIRDPETPVRFAKRPEGVVEFDRVCFRYGGAQEDALHDVSFTARPGEVTAFIGSTGSGKSTLVNLIPRFYDVSRGGIRIDGVDIRELAQRELRENIGYVPQKGLLFSGSMADNLRFGDGGAEDEALREAADVAQASEFIDKLEGGFGAAVSRGGTNLSGGQRQRAAIARALVRRAPVYIFDDCFSALDYATDARLRAALRPYTRQSAVLIVAQRVSTVMRAEQIVVLDKGRVAGIGRHEELLRGCEAYREIAQSQLSMEELA